MIDRIRVGGLYPFRLLCTLTTVDDPTEHVPAVLWTVSWIMLGRHRTVLADALVRPRMIVRGDVLRENPPQMTRIHHH